MKSPFSAIVFLALISSSYADKENKAHGFDGIYVGLADQRSVKQNHRIVKAPIKAVVYPDGKSILVNIEMLTVSSIPVRGSFKGNVFSGTMKKNLGTIQVRSAVEVKFIFSDDGKKVTITSDGEVPTVLYREETPEAKAIRKKWAASLEDIKKFDPSKTPFTGKSLNVSTDSLSALYAKKHSVFGIFQVGSSFSKFTRLEAVTRDLEMRLYAVRVPSHILPLTAVKGAFIAVPENNPLLIIPGANGISDYGEIYDLKNSKNLEIIRK